MRDGNELNGPLKHASEAITIAAPSGTSVVAAAPPAAAAPAVAAEREFVRFNRLHRTLHAGMIVSFLSLATTGLTLKFSYTKWAVMLSRLLGGFQTAGYIHRFAAVIMFSVFVTHLTDLYRSKKRGQQSWRSLLFGPNTLLPTREDFHDFVATMKWFLHLGPRRTLDLLGEVRLLRRILGDLHHRVHRADALVPGVLHAIPARIVH
jgi:hypothetical protein